jgi:glucuronate isomerase
MFLNEDFLLKNEWAKKLFHGYAEHQPIIDYHCHLEAKEIYENKHFENLTKIWLNKDGVGDHYKWRLMRANGVPEELISGNGKDFDKFLAFVKTIEKAYGNPVYEWSHLELKRYFNIDLVIKEENATLIWKRANELLKQPSFKPKALINAMNVQLIATTDDPISELNYHRLLKNEEQINGFKVVPTFRPDKIMSISDSSFSDYVALLGECVKHSIKNLSDLEQALNERISYFHDLNGRLADHGLNNFYFIESDYDTVNDIFINALDNKAISDSDRSKYQSYLQLFLMSMYEKRNWTMQLHMNVFRNASQLNFDLIGADSGFDSIGDQAEITGNLKRLYAAAEKNGSVPKSIWYSLNQNNWLELATLMGSFQGGSQQKIQLGCAWWFNDTYDGMRKQLTVFSQQSLLGNFVGMLTDSRSFLSYPRHEYFRRILCQLLGEWINEGRLPDNEEEIGAVVQNISHRNAEHYFGFFDTSSD